MNRRESLYKIALIFESGAITMFTFQNFPLVIVITLVVMAWLSFFSVILS